MRTPFVEIGVLLAESDPYAAAGREILEHYGLRVQFLGPGWRERLAQFDVMVLFGKGSLDRTDRMALAEWVADGGRLICAGGGWGIEPVLGVMPFEPYELSRDHMGAPENQADFWPEEAPHIRFFGGACAVSKSADVLVATTSGRIAISRQVVGKGEGWFFAPHVGQTMVLMQQGRAVETDAVGPSDGSAWLTDGILRAEDGSHLDFETDRTPGESSHPAFFGLPYADLLKELLLKLVLHVVDGTGKRAVMVYPWPKGAPLVGMMTAECDTVDTDNVLTVKSLMEQASIPTTWLVPKPGLPLEIFRAFLRRGDEVGLLFQPGENWSDTAFRSQYLLIHRMSSMTEMIAVRPEDGRWKGYLDFYRICDGAGARVSFSKGGRQSGSTGFLFGTCHPFHPIRPDGRRFFCLEVPPVIFEPGRCTPTLTGHALMRQVALRHGCVTVAVPAGFLERETAPVALKQLQAISNEMQVAWLRPAELLRFQKARRKLSWHTEPGERLVCNTDGPLKSVVILISGDLGDLILDSKRASVRHLRRFGRDFQAVYADLRQRDRLVLRYQKSQPTEIELPLAA